MNRRHFGAAFGAVLAVPLFDTLVEAQQRDEVLHQLLAELQQIQTAPPAEKARRLASTMRLTSAHFKATKFDKTLRDTIKKRVKRDGIEAFEEDLRKEAVKAKQEMRKSMRSTTEGLMSGRIVVTDALIASAALLDQTAPTLAKLDVEVRRVPVQGTGMSRERECAMFTDMIAFYEWLRNAMLLGIPLGQPEAAVGAAVIEAMILSLQAMKWWMGCPA